MRPRIGRKFYKPAIGKVESSFSKVVIYEQMVKKAKKAIENRFLPDLEKIQADDSEKIRFRQFLEENIRIFDLMLKYIGFLNRYYGKVKEKLEKSRSYLPDFSQLPL